MGWRWAKRLFTLNSRMGGRVPVSPACSLIFATSNLAELLSTIHCMLDWPDAIQTSPTRRSLRMTVLPSFSRMVISLPSALVFSGSRWSIHFLSAPAMVDFFCPANSTVTSVPGLDQPQTGTLLSRCNTAPSRKGAPMLISSGGGGGGASPFFFLAPKAAGASNRVAAKLSKKIDMGLRNTFCGFIALRLVADFDKKMWGKNMDSEMGFVWILVLIFLSSIFLSENSDRIL